MKCVLRYMAWQICIGLWENFIAPVIAVVVVLGIPITIGVLIFSLIPERIQALIGCWIFGCICAIAIISIAYKIISLYQEAKQHCQ